MSADLLWLVAPVVGALANVAAQLLLARTPLARNLLLLIVAAFAVGALVTAALVAAAIAAAPIAPWEAVGLAGCVGLSYAAAGFCIFAVVNLGETSIRARMVARLMASPEGVPVAAMVAEYDSARVAETRLRRIRESGGARIVGNQYYPKVTLLFVMSWAIGLLQRLIYGSSRR